MRAAPPGPAARPPGSLFVHSFFGAAHEAALHMTTSHEPAIAVGPFIVSPLVTPTEAGRYAASAVIRSGQGRATHHRVLRFVPRFHSRESARRYAVEHGVAHASTL